MAEETQTIVMVEKKKKQKKEERKKIWIEFFAFDFTLRLAGGWQQ